MTHATLRGNGNTLHHISGETLAEVFATAGLLASAINTNNGYFKVTAPNLSLSVVSEGFEGVFSVDEYLICGFGTDPLWLKGGTLSEQG